MGVLTNASSVLIALTAGDARPAEGRPAEGRPAEASELRHGAEWGVLDEAADLSASAGNDAETGVVMARTGLLAGMLEARADDEDGGAGWLAGHTAVTRVGRVMEGGGERPGTLGRQAGGGEEEREEEEQVKRMTRRAYKPH